VDALDSHSHLLIILTAAQNDAANVVAPGVGIDLR
jgi:hypothetical protein